MEPEEINKLGDVFKFLGEQQKKLQDIADSIKMDRSKITNVEFDGIDYTDRPDFCDAFILSADYKDRPMTESELDEINEDRDFIYEKLIEYLY